MRAPGVRGWTALVVACCVAVSAASRAESPRALLERAEFLAAADAGAAQGSAEGYALAAEALTLHGTYFVREADKPALFERAMAYASRAIELEPDSSHAHLQAANATGRFAQTLSSIKALGAGYPYRIKAHLDTAIELDPGNYEAFASRGSWHASVVGHAGGFVGSFLFGASEEQAYSDFERALTLAPSSIRVQHAYGNALLALGTEESRRQAVAVLQAAARMSPRNAYEKVFLDVAARDVAEFSAR